MAQLFLNCWVELEIERSQSQALIWNFIKRKQQIWDKTVTFIAQLGESHFLETLLFVLLVVVVILYFQQIQVEVGLDIILTKC